MQAGEDVPLGDVWLVWPGFLGVGPRRRPPRRALGPRRYFHAAACNNPKRDLGRPQAGDGS